MDLSVPGRRQVRQYDRLLSLADTQRQGSEAISGQGPEWPKGLGEANCHQHRQAPTYGIAISELKAEGKCPKELVHRQVKYLNNVVEADHGKLKQLIKPVRGFKTLKTALRNDQGFRGHASST